MDAFSGPGMGVWWLLPQKMDRDRWGIFFAAEIILPISKFTVSELYLQNSVNLWRGFDIAGLLLLTGYPSFFSGLPACGLRSVSGKIL